jgi:hypothetical protein
MWESLALKTNFNLIGCVDRKNFVQPNLEKMFVKKKKNNNNHPILSREVMNAKIINAKQRTVTKKLGLATRINCSY